MKMLRGVARRIGTSPGVTSAAVLMLGFLIAANVAMFAIVNAVFWAPLGLPAADRMVMIWQTSPRRGVVEYPTSVPNLLDWQGSATHLERIGGFDPVAMDLGSPADSRETPGAFLTSGMAAMMSARPALGRFLQPSDFLASSPPVVVLSEGIWRERFNADPGICGRAIWLHTDFRTVVGVASKDVSFPYPLFSPRPSFWIPDTLDPHTPRAARTLYAVGLLRNSKGLSAARSEMTGIAANLARAYPHADGGWGVSLAPLRDAVTRKVRSSMIVIWAAIAGVFLVSCANIACLLTVRLSGRAAEIAVRLALGATPGRIGRLMLAEGSVIVALGLALGIAIAGAAMPFLRSRLQAIGLVPRVEDAALSIPAVLGALAIALVALAISCGAPMLLAWRGGSTGLIANGLRASRTTIQKPGFALHGLLMSQTAVTMALTLLSLGISETLWQRLAAGTAYRLDTVGAARVRLPNRIYMEPSARERFFAGLDVQARRQPGVRAAGLIDASAGGLNVRVVAPSGVETSALLRIATADYFGAMRARFVSGRSFSARSGAVEAVVNRTAARLLSPGDLIGADLRGEYVARDKPWRVAGVIEDLPEVDGLGARPVVYLPFGTASTPTMMWLIARVEDSTMPVFLRDVRSVARGIEPEARVDGASTLKLVLSENLVLPELRTEISGGLGGLALILAAIAVYGITSFVSHGRRRDIAIRIAIGAKPSDVARLVTLNALWPVVAGLALGAGLFAAASRPLSLLLEEPGNWPAVNVAVAVSLVLAVSLVSVYGPARSAAATNPAAVLAGE